MTKTLHLALLAIFAIVGTARAADLEPILETVEGIEEIEGGEASDGAPLPAQFEDTSFDRFVDLQQLAPAWLDMDADTLTDLALQFGEGERVLHRRHYSGINSTKVLQLAAKVAIAKRNTEALQRIAEAAKARADKDTVALIEAAQKTLSAARSVDTAVEKLGESVSADELATIQANANTIEALQIVNDRAALQSIDEHFADMEISDVGVEALKKLSADARSATSEESDELAEQLKQLADSTRGEESNRNEVRARVAAGGWQVAWGVTVNEAEYAKFLAACGVAASTGNPAPVERYFSNYLKRTIDKIGSNLSANVRADLQKRIVSMLKKGGEFTMGKVNVKAGIATHQRWNVVIYDEPRTKMCEKKVGNKYIGYRTVKYPCVYTVRVQKKIPLPNHHMPFVAYRIR